MASPLRLEILGLFTGNKPLAIADMARLMGRTAGSLYFHVGILERARLLKRAGTRPRGKRYEALYYPTASRFEVQAEKHSGNAALAIKTLASAFRMAERDMEASLRRNDRVTAGPGRNVLGFRAHLRASPQQLSRINRHLDAILALLQSGGAAASKPSPDDQHVSLTIALLPLKGRGSEKSNERGSQ
jgi:hypothetical protein